MFSCISILELRRSKGVTSRMVDAKNFSDSSLPRVGATRETIAEWFEALSNWGRWGKEDELGALNLITAEKRRDAAALVKSGISVSLSRNVLKHRVGVSAPFEHTM